MSDRPGQYTYSEITSQADAWENALDVLSASEKALRRLLTEFSPAGIIHTGCGSTYYLALSAAALTQRSTGIPSRATPASEIILFPETILTPNIPSLLIAISRSGSTTETVEAARRFRANGYGRIVTITNCDDCPLVELADISLVATAGRERSIAQTRSFASMWVIAAGLAVMLGGGSIPESWGNLPDRGRKLIKAAEHMAIGLADPDRYERYFFLGSGPNYGLACEAMLKMKEMSQTHSEAYHFMEFRHGPKSMVNGQTLIVGLVSERGMAEETAVLREMKELGATTLALTSAPDSLPDGSADFVINIGPQIPLPARRVLYLPGLQLTAYHRSMLKGLDPDHPANLDAVVRLEGLSGE